MSCRRANAPQGYSYDLSDEDAQELGRRSIIAAGHRDAYSGNTCNLFHVRQDGWEFIGACGVTRRFVASFLGCLISWLPHFFVSPPRRPVLVSTLSFFVPSPTAIPFPPRLSSLRNSHYCSYITVIPVGRIGASLERAGRIVSLGENPR
jgi:hypothetical protein